MLMEPVLAFPDTVLTTDCHDQLVVQVESRTSSKMVNADPEVPVVLPVVVEAEPVVVPGVPVVAEAVVADAVVAEAVVAEAVVAAAVVAEAVVAEAVVAAAVVAVVAEPVLLTGEPPIMMSMQVV